MIGPEDKQAFEKYWQANDLPFIGLPDPNQVVIRTYGQEVNPLKLGRMPAQVIIDKQGNAKYVHYSNSMMDIPPNVELLGILDELNSDRPVAS